MIKQKNEKLKLEFKNVMQVFQMRENCLYFLETDLSTKCVVQMDSDQTFLFHPGEEKHPKSFAFDHCFESSDPSGAKFASKLILKNPSEFDDKMTVFRSRRSFHQSRDWSYRQRLPGI